LEALGVEEEEADADEEPVGANMTAGNDNDEELPG
jgi:hypothetical protein